MRAVALVGLAAGTALIAAASPSAASPRTASSVASGSWQTQLYLPASSSRAQSSLTSVSAPAADDAWVVGGADISRPRSYRSRTVIDHWDGRHWRYVRGPVLRGTRGWGLTSVSAEAADAWFVGTAEYGRDFDGGDFVAQLNGGRWTVHQLGVGWVVRHLAVFGPSDVWALGSTGCCPGTPAYAHWDGASWTTGGLPALPYGEPDNSVAAAWATAEDPSTYTPELLHYDGAEWQVAPSPDVVLPAGASGAFFQDVVQSADDVWLTVGFAAHDGEAPGLQLWRWDGQAWQQRFSRRTASPYGASTDGQGGLWLYSAGQQRHGEFLHVVGRTLAAVVHPPVVAAHVTQVEAFTLLPGTTQLLAVGEVITAGTTAAVAATYQP